MASLDEFEKLGGDILAGKAPPKKRTKFDDMEDAGGAILEATPLPVVPRVVPPVVAPAAPSSTMPTVGEYGQIIGEPLPGQDTFNKIANTGLAAYRNTPSFWTGPKGESTRAQVENMDPYGFGRFIVAPAGDLVSGAFGVGSGLFRAGQEAVRQAIDPISPLLARDIAAIPEAFPTGFGGMRPRPPEINLLNRPAFVSERTAPARPEGMTDAERINQLIAHDETETGPRVGKVPPTEETRAAPNSTGDVHEGEAPSPRSGGAAATPGGDIPDQTRVERARNLRVSINETARQRAGPSLVDDQAYVTTLPNSPDPLPPRMRPERDFDPQTALDHKERYGEDAPGYRADYDANHTARNQGMRDLLEHDAGDGITLDQLRKTRREVAPDAFGAFEGEQPVDASGLRTRIQSVLDGPEGKRGAVERTLNSVLDRLHDREGNLETMPSTLYGVRKHIDDLIEKARKPTDREGSDAAVSVHILRDLAPETDNLIQSGAGRYQAYRDAYREASQPVNQQRFLQQYTGGTKKLWDSQGNLQLERVNRMLEDIHKGLADTKFNLAQSLTEEQIQNIVNVRNELAARSLRDEQAKVPGSPTVQLLNQAAKRGTGPLAQTLKHASELAVHGAAAYVEGGPSLLNAPIAAWTVTRHIREARKAAKTQAKIEDQTNALKQRLLSQEPVNPLTLYDQ